MFLLYILYILQVSSIDWFLKLFLKKAFSAKKNPNEILGNVGNISMSFFKYTVLFVLSD